MCAESEYFTLTQTENCQITFCKSCGTFTLTFNSCSASFTPLELTQFRRILENLTDWDFYFEALDQQMTLLKKPGTHIGFCLSKSDVAYLSKAIGESEVLFDAYNIIHK